MAKGELKKYEIEPKDTNQFVSCMIFDKDDRPLRLTRNINQKSDQGKYDLCSGHIKLGEIPLQAMIREIIEELGIYVEDVKEMYSLGTMDTPHPKLEDTTTHIYCLVTKLSIEEINQKIQSIENEEIKEATALDSIEELENQIQDSESNWRVFYTSEMKQKLIIMKNIFKERNKQAER